MWSALLRAVVLIVVLVAAASFLLGWWGTRPDDPPRDTVGTMGVDRERAREIGAEAGDRTAAALDQAQRALIDGRITAKIKAKMALDDTVKALDVDVDTSGAIVTVSGTVGSAAQKERVLELAKETDGVKEVVDRLQVKQ